MDELIANDNVLPRKGIRVRMTRLVGMMAPVCLLAVQLAGCAAGTKITSKRLCEGRRGGLQAREGNEGR